MRVGPARMDAAVADPQDRPTQGGCASGQRTRFFTLTRPVWTGIDVLGLPRRHRLEPHHRPDRRPQAVPRRNRPATDRGTHRGPPPAGSVSDWNRHTPAPVPRSPASSRCSPNSCSPSTNSATGCVPCGHEKPTCAARSMHCRHRQRTGRPTSHSPTTCKDSSRNRTGPPTRRAPTHPAAAGQGRPHRPGQGSSSATASPSGPAPVTPTPTRRVSQPRICLLRWGRRRAPLWWDRTAVSPG